MGSEYESSEGEQEEREAENEAKKKEDEDFEAYIEKDSHQIEAERMDSDAFISEDGEVAEKTLDVDKLKSDEKRSGTRSPDIRSEDNGQALLSSPTKRKFKEMEVGSALTKSRHSNYSSVMSRPLPFNAVRFIANHLKRIKEEGTDVIIEEEAMVILKQLPVA